MPNITVLFNVNLYERYKSASVYKGFCPHCYNLGLDPRVFAFVGQNLDGEWGNPIYIKRSQNEIWSDLVKKHGHEKSEISTVRGSSSEHPFLIGNRLVGV